MKTILLLIGLFSCFSIKAQTTIDKPVVCTKAVEMVAGIEKFGEKVIWASPSPVEKSNYVFFGNRETGTWSLVQIVQDIGCLVAYGEAGKVKDQL
jgi:hypothetical protein